jgi:hypothetical protein
MAKRRHKYNAVRIEYGGAIYDSKAEATRAAELDVLLKHDRIQNWERQVTVELVKGFKARIDFKVHDPAGQGSWYEDVKGVETQRTRDIKRLWAAHGPLPLVILKRRGNGWTKEIINGKN